MTEEFIQRRVLLGVSGASGSIYADLLLDQLVSRVDRVYLIFTDTAEKVCRHELIGDAKSRILMRALNGELTKTESQKIRLFKNDDLFAPIASGSSAPQSMVVAPCSMGSLARIAQGMSTTLLERAADVMIKHRRQLIICPRETPFSLIHLRNMTALAEAGVELLPLMPAFYQKPQSIDDLVGFCVGRILEQMHLEHDLYAPWNPRMR